MKVPYRWSDTPSVALCPWCKGDFRDLSDQQYEQAQRQCACPFCARPVVFNFSWEGPSEIIRIWPIMTSADADYILAAKSEDLVQHLFRYVVEQWGSKVGNIHQQLTLQFAF